MFCKTHISLSPHIQRKLYGIYSALFLRYVMAYTTLNKDLRCEMRMYVYNINIYRRVPNNVYTF
jgi:hypothetical protein